MFRRQGTKLVAAVIFVCAVLFTLFPAEYARQFSTNFPFEPLDKLAFKLTDFNVMNNLKYGCDNPVYFGYKTPFGIVIPGISIDKIHEFYTEKKENIVFFFASDVDLPLNWVASSQDIEYYNTMILDKCTRRQVN